jgi:hypothetical protein
MGEFVCAPPERGGRITIRVDSDVSRLSESCGHFFTAARRWDYATFCFSVSLGVWLFFLPYLYLYLFFSFFSLTAFFFFFFLLVVVTHIYMRRGRGGGGGGCLGHLCYCLSFFLCFFVLRSTFYQVVMMTVRGLSCM